MKVSQQVQNRIIIASAIIIAAAILWNFTGLHDLFDGLIAFLAKVARRSGPVGAIAFTGLATLGAAIGPFTAVPLVPAAIRVWGNLQTGAMLLLGSLLGGALTYLIGRFAGERVLKLFVRQKKLERMREQVPEGTAFFLAVIIKFALPAEVGYAFGAIRFGFFKYLLVALLSNLPIVFLIVFASDAYVSGRLLTFVLSVAALIALTAIAGRHLYRLDEKKKKPSA